MMEIVSTKKNIAMVVFTIGEKIHITLLEKYNPNVLDVRTPVFDGTFEQCVKYVHGVL